MKVLVIGSGAREHAIVWKLAGEVGVEEVVCAPGNAGIAQEAQCIDIGGEDLDGLLRFAQAESIDLTIVGPEAPLVAGIVDLFESEGLLIFGPGRGGAQLEGSKAFAKDFMNRHGIPTADAESFTNAPDAIAYIRDNGAPIVIKADGLAAGKGVTVAETEAAAIAAVEDCFSGTFGAAGESVLIEECMVGEEASIFAFVDHDTIKPLASSQDHKRVGNGDTGPNTGGMGAYSPAPVVDDALWAQIHERILNPFLAGCQADGLDYRGVIYVGIMATAAGPRVVEFNVRFGAPECQPICMRMKSALAEAMLAPIETRLADFEFGWKPDPAVCIVIASGGYPGPYEKGKVISGLEAAETNGAIVFHAGTQRSGDDIVTAGGRVLGVTATGTDVKAAADTAYTATQQISWDGAFYRKDIAHRAIARLA